MRIAGYLVGYNVQGKLCHLVVDVLPPKSNALVFADLLRRRDSLRRPVYDLLINTGDQATPYLCLPALPEEVASHFQQGDRLPLRDLSSLREIHVEVRDSELEESHNEF